MHCVTACLALAVRESHAPSVAVLTEQPFTSFWTSRSNLSVSGVVYTAAAAAPAVSRRVQPNGCLSRGWGHRYWCPLLLMLHVERSIFITSRHGIIGGRHPRRVMLAGRQAYRRRSVDNHAHAAQCSEYDIRSISAIDFTLKLYTMYTMLNSASSVVSFDRAPGCGPPRACSLA